MFDIDWQGTQQLKRNKNLSLVTFFILPPDIKTLKDRLINRHKGQENLIQQRMKKFDEDILHWKTYDFVVINDNLQNCYNQITNLIDQKMSNTKIINYDQSLVSKHINKLIK